ncbi:MAG: aminotransferase class V-fold PLP-dependent enzyme [Candidatus Dormibacteria bacterium]
MGAEHGHEAGGMGTSAEFWHGLREGYPGALRSAYLDTACKGIPPEAAIDAITEFGARTRECKDESATAGTASYMGHLEEARGLAASMISADPDEIALVESTQAGIREIARSLDLPAGSSVVTSDCEFLATVVPWRSLASRGVTTMAARHRGGVLDLGDVEEAIDENTRVVSVSACQEISGACVDLAALSEMCKRRGLILVVDGTQFLGARTIDVRQLPIDILAVGGHKWLLNPFGLGFLYVRREILDKVDPSVYGYMALDLPDGGLLAEVLNGHGSTLMEMAFTKSARKFEGGGTGPYMAAAALAASLGELQRIGLHEIEGRVAELCGWLHDELSALGCLLATPGRQVERAGIVTFSTGSGDQDRILHRSLRLAGIGTSLRYRDGSGGIRVSPYFYSDQEDLARLMRVVATSRSGPATSWPKGAQQGHLEV